MTSATYPAVQHYWFGKAYRDLIATISDVHLRNRSTAQGYWYRAGKGNWIVAVVCWTAAVMVAVGGTALWLILFPIHLALVLGIALLLAVSYLLMDMLERTYLFCRNWTTYCRHCGERVAIPHYQCPKCGAWHSQLRPSSYGILRHRCRCGQWMPCTFLSNRHTLQARCPFEHCHKPLDANTDTRSVSAVIALIGPPNAGKTAFMVAAMEAMTNQLAAQRLLVSEFRDRTTEQFFREEKKSILSTGRTRKTVENKPPASSVLFRSQDDRVRHQVLFFDAAGETFLSTDRLRGHHQFKHLTGGVILVDPFSLPRVRVQYGAALVDGGLDTIITNEEAINVIDHFLIAMQRHFGLKQDQLLRSPYAVVVTKTDLCGIGRILESPTHPSADIWTETKVISSTHIRTQLIHWGAGALVTQIESRFSNVMYFAAAPIRLGGAAAGHKAELARVGVVAPLRWIFESAQDPVWSKKWDDTPMI